MTEATRATGRRKQRKGVVVSDKMDKSVVVAVMRVRRHPLYKKTVRSTKKYLAHSPENDVRIGDRVLIEETRPLSKRKHWRVLEVLERGEQATQAETEVLAEAVE
ncbi:MAG: 30S ribosomal protein S17 [Chloroflexota bacterium]|nr:30S ribosomal protein S17 [Chloroflexota bacterium]MDE2841338.1 30S ribosomal protein S17 [Chloroflexota bacterium]MDE2929794.1 30S ribosomal protein S17 [Chloroflexota bacterium]